MKRLRLSHRTHAQKPPTAGYQADERYGARCQRRSAGIERRPAGLMEALGAPVERRSARRERERPGPTAATRRSASSASLPSFETPGAPDLPRPPGEMAHHREAARPAIRADRGKGDPRPHRLGRLGDGAHHQQRQAGRRRDLGDRVALGVEGRGEGRLERAPLGDRPRSAPRRCRRSARPAP